MAGTSAPSDSGGTGSYRPRQLLVAKGDVRRVAQAMSEMDLGRIDADQPPDDVGLVRITWEAPLDAGKVVDDVRQAATTDLAGAPAVSPNHIFAPDVDPTSGARVDPILGQPVDMGGPAEPPTVTKRKLKARTGSHRAGEGVTVGVIDTGATAHPWLDGAMLAAPDDFDPVDTDGDGELDVQAGHGTFVAGIVLQHAPGATVRIARVLDHRGEAEVQSVANAIVRLGKLGCDIINLSLGGYTRRNNEPQAVREALKGLSPDVVVVAAAGNHDPEKVKGLDATRKFWPAASDGVVAVAALDPLKRGKPPVRASFSNFGEWVDVSAVGVDQLSTFVTFNQGDLDFDGFATWNGTSFAAPSVAGTIAARMTDLKGDRVRSAKQARDDILNREADGEVPSFAGLTAMKDVGVGRFLRLKSPFA